MDILCGFWIKGKGEGISSHKVSNFRLALSLSESFAVVFNTLEWHERKKVTHLVFLS